MVQGGDTGLEGWGPPLVLEEGHGGWGPQLVEKQGEKGKWTYIMDSHGLKGDLRTKNLQLKLQKHQVTTSPLPQ